MEKNSKKKHIIKFALLGFITLVFGLLSTLSGVYLYLSPNLPSISSLKEVELQIPLRIYSINNKLIGQFGEKRRAPIGIDETPKVLLDAFLAAEDDSFFQHKGIDPNSLLRATYQLLLSGEIQSGGSTITMQVARNFFLSSEQTFSRKFNEILLAFKIERLLTKGEILELYINRIYLGNRAYGVKVAAEVYYGVDLNQLSLAQMAMIAGLPKAPSTDNPLTNPERAKNRRNWILGRMLKLGKISESDYKKAVEAPVSARYFGQNLDFDAPFVAELAREKAVELFGESAYTGGYTVVATVDSRLQDAAQQALTNGLLDYDRRHGYRGPEQKLDITDLDFLRNSDIPIENHKERISKHLDGEEVILSLSLEGGRSVDLKPWMHVLKNTPVYRGLEPAIVVNVEAEKIDVLNIRAAIESIPWKSNLDQTRRYDEDSVMGPPESPEALFEVGDLIRIRPGDEAGWQLSQIPDAEAALVSIRPEDGSVEAIVGGFDFKQSKFNRAIQAKRQTGSNFKPFIYTRALEKGLTPASIFNDAPLVIKDSRLESIWRPQNASGKFYGPTRLREALYSSRNLVSIRLLRKIGIGDTVRAMDRFGVDTQAISKNLSIALGSYVMSPLEVAIGYTVFANGGYRVEPYWIHHIRDRHDKVVYRATPYVVPEKLPLRFSSAEKNTSLPKKESITTEKNASSVEPTSISQLSLSEAINLKVGANGEYEESQLPYIDVELETLTAERVVDQRIVYIMNSMLRDVIKKGTGRRALSLKRADLAGKTGTTNGPTDAWFSGFNHRAVTTTWLGFDNNQNLGRGEYGGIAALPIWIDYMKVVLDGVPEYLPPQPDGIVTIRIDPKTGKRTSPTNPQGIFELFLEENTPSERPETSGNSENSGSRNPAPEDLF
ncbi:MAG: penicillin-binding protein 1A [Cellvibrionaceae bacterium]|jgi:penicillin-binding protein 1A